MMPPTLVTSRLVLRPHLPSDLDEELALWSNPEVVRYLGVKSLSRPDAWARLLRYAGLWQFLGYGCWAALEKDAGRFVGDVGLFDFKRALEPPVDTAPEAAWVLAPWAHGRGYATEAIRAVLAWSDGALPARHTSCLIAPENAPSIRVALKCGYALQGRHRGGESFWDCYSRAARGESRPGRVSKVV
jgi:RimJ/RimL family protein N-acetyltransferase